MPDFYMNDAATIQSQLTDSEAYYSHAGPLTQLQWNTILAMNAGFAHLDEAVIQQAPHSKDQESARDLLKKAHAAALKSITDHWVEPESVTEVSEPEVEPEPEPEPEE